MTLVRGELIRIALWEIIFGLQNIAKETSLWNTTRQHSEKRLNEFLEAIISMATLDFSRVLEVSDEGNVFDALATGMNSLREELQASTVSKAYLNEVINSMIDTLIVVNTEGIIESVNKATLELLGYEEKELIGKSLTMLLSGISEEEMFPDFLNVSEHIKNIELVYITSDNHQIPVLFSASMMFDNSNEISGIVCVAHDITKQKQAEIENKRLVSLVENSNDFIAMVSMDGKVEFVNEAGRQLVGLQQEENVQNKSITEFLTEEGLQVSQKIEVPAVQQYGNWSGESTLRHFITGDVIPVAIDSFLILDEKTGKPMGLGTVQRDITERKLQEELILKTKNEYENLVEQAKVLIIKIDKYGITNFANSYAQHFFGFNNNELLGKHITETIFPLMDLQGNDVRKMMDSALSNPDEFEDSVNENICKNGQKKTISWANKPIYNEEGEFIELLSVGTDLTEQRKAEMEVQKLASIVQNSPEFIGIASLDAKSEFLNTAGRELVGLDSEELFHSSTMMDFYSDEGKEKMKNKVLPQVMEKGRWVGEINFQHFKTKELIPVLHDVFRVDDSSTGEPINLATVTRDIRKDKEYREKLIKNEKALREAQKVGKVGSWEFDLVTNKLHWSEEIYRLLGIELFSVDVTYKMFLSYIHPEDRDRVSEAYRKHIEEHVEYNIVHRVVLADNDIKYVQERCETEWDSNGKAISSLGTATDITEQKLIEIELKKYKDNLENIVLERTGELEQANEELEQAASEIKKAYDEQLDLFNELKSTQSQLVQSEKMASLGVLTAGIAHEINNPVNFVYAGIHSLEENLKDVRKVLDAYDQVDSTNAAIKIPEIQSIKSELQFDKLMYFVDRSTTNIKKGAERTSEIIKGLKTFSRLDSDNLIEVDIHENIENTLLLLRNQYKDRITIDKQYGDLPTIKCYPGKLSQVFVNIIDNATQAIKGEGKITIITSKHKEKGKDYLMVKIADTGQGISDKLIKRIFEPFFTTKDVGKGTGLGLSISLAIIESHEGYLEVESEEGEGTEFRIFLPM